MISFERVTYSYPDASAPSLRDVTLHIGAGELVVLAGLSGSGKSTLLRACCGLVPHFHGGEIAGRVTVAGLDTRAHGPDAIGAVAGTLLQDPETQVVMGTVRAEIALPLENRGEPAERVARGVEEVALALGIAPLLGRATAELSGGELQRVALAAALAGRPDVVLLDEPTSQLDPVAGDELLWLLRRLNEEWGTTIVLAEQRLERCLAAADRVVALRDGAVACDAQPGAFLQWAGEHAPPLQTPGARLLAGVGLAPAAGVKTARAALRAARLAAPAEPRSDHDEAPARARGGLRARRARRAAAALTLERVWDERRGGRAILRGIELMLAPGERGALMGRNGAGKSTLLRHAAGLLQPTRGRVRAAGRVALLLQNPGDYLISERVADDVPADALAASGLAQLGERHPRDLSGGERQRLALALVLAGTDDPAVVALDEPTRGMDRACKEQLGERIAELAASGAAVIVATHDPEFAASFAQRVVLLGEGEVVADGPARSLLCGGWYFATETARILGGAGEAIVPADGVALLRGPAAAMARGARRVSGPGEDGAAGGEARREGHAGDVDAAAAPAGASLEALRR